MSQKQSIRILCILPKQQVYLLMASEIKLSATNFIQLRHLLTPKHLQLPPTRRKQHTKDKYLLEPAAVTIQQNKMSFLRPIQEIETIMRHFDAKFDKAQGKQERASSQQRVNTSVPGSLLHPSDKQMNELINLPTLKSIKRRAQSYRNALNAQEIQERNVRKQKIMENFNAYLKAELKGNYSLNRKRLNTIN